MEVTRFLLGVIALAAIVGPLILAAIHLRRWLVPGWGGAASRLAEIVLTVSGLILVVELVGVVGLYRPGFLIAGSVLASVAAIFLLRRYAPSPRAIAPLKAPPVSLTTGGLALLGTLGVTAQWAFVTLQSLNTGMYLPNTTWHNAPFAARFVQEGQIGLPHFTEIYELTVWFYPQNSELLHSIGILTLGTDVLSPTFSIGWLLLAFVAAWVIGRPYGVGPTVVVAVAILFGTRMLVNFGPGDAKNDVMTLFCLLAALGFLVNGEVQRKDTSEVGEGTIWGRFGFGPLLLASLATGIAIGTRLNYLLPAFLLTVAVIYLSFRGQRLRSAGIWVGGLLLMSAFWYLRNLFLSGNPLPWIRKLGPIELPHPNQLPLDVRPAGTVAEYLTDLGVQRSIFLPKVIDGFGDLWFLVLGAAVLFTILAIFKGPTRTVRALGVVAILSFIGYLFTPLTAAGGPGLSGFEINMRYSAPALAIAMAIGPLSAIFRRTGLRKNLLVIALTVILVFTVWPSAPLIGEIASGTKILIGFDLSKAQSAMILALLLVLVPLGLNALWGRRRLRGFAIAASIVAGIGFLAIAFVKTDNYTQTRYAKPFGNPEGPLVEFWPAVEWGQSLTDQRIGIVGSKVSFKQYLLYGKDLSNTVLYVGASVSNGGLRPIRECEAFRRRVNALDLDYLLITPYLRAARESIPLLDRLDEGVWVEGTPQARVVLRATDIRAYRIDGPLDPDSCPN